MRELQAKLRDLGHKLRQEATRADREEARRLPFLETLVGVLDQSQSLIDESYARTLRGQLSRIQGARHLYETCHRVFVACGTLLRGLDARSDSLAKDFSRSLATVARRVDAWSNPPNWPMDFRYAVQGIPDPEGDELRRQALYAHLLSNPTWTGSNSSNDRGVRFVFPREDVLDHYHLPHRSSAEFRYEPPGHWRPNTPPPLVDRHGQEWRQGPSRTPGEDFEWDVQIPAGRVAALKAKGIKVHPGNPAHVNVSWTGKVTH
jgi:hypothetical protein